MNNVAVLLASYNGEKFIETQIDSILSQLDCKVDIIVSDDCSTDSTLQILNKLSRNNKNIKIVTNQDNKGCTANFYKLFNILDIEKYDYVALSDQDDFFLKNKFSYSINLLKKYNSDVISTAVQCFGQQNTILRLSNKMNKYDYFFEGGGHGCTFVMTKSFFKSFQKFTKKNYNYINNFFFHDWLIYIFCRVKGYKWFFYNKPLTLYRIHETNILGNRFSIKGAWKRLNLIFDGFYMKQIYIANKISILLNPSLINIEKLNDFKFFLFMIKNGKRKYKDRILSAILVFLAKLNS